MATDYPRLVDSLKDSGGNHSFEEEDVLGLCGVWDIDSKAGAWHPLYACALTLRDKGGNVLRGVVKLDAVTNIELILGGQKGGEVIDR